MTTSKMILTLMISATLKTSQESGREILYMRRSMQKRKTTNRAAANATKMKTKAKVKMTSIFLFLEADTSLNTALR